jgi:DegV family protein with EDD domain
MQILTDSGYDLSPEQRHGTVLHTVPLKITLDGMTYRSGVDIQPEAFYDLLASTDQMPVTSTPSPGEFEARFKEIAKTDPEILSVHISSGMSATYQIAQQVAPTIEGANITVVDTRTLSAEMGWQVEAALRGAGARWPRQKILDSLTAVRNATEMIFTLPDLSYLIHGGRISHIKGLLASLLGIKPLIGVDKTDGKYYQRDKARTFNKALRAIPAYIAAKVGEGASIRVQIGHAGNPEGAENLREMLDGLFACDWLPNCSISPVLGAHTGRGLVGAVFAPAAEMPALP